MSLVVPAVLPTSKRDFEEKLALFASWPAVSRVQVDVVDGRFVPAVSWPYTSPKEFTEMVERGELLPHLDHIGYEIDLMCAEAERAAELWIALGATRLTFHAESATDLPRLLSYVRTRYGTSVGFASGLVSFGIALNVGSDMALIEPCLSEVEYVQFMGIRDIGRQGQPFDEMVIDKVRTFRAKHPSMPVQIDGGVSLHVAEKLVALGVTNLIVGSALLRAKNPIEVLKAFEELESPFGI